MVIPAWIRVVFISLFVVWIAWQPVVGVLVDWLWFDSLGHLDLYRTTLTARVGAWLVGLVLALSFIGLQLRLATRRAPINTMRLSLLLAEVNLVPTRLQRNIRLALAAALVLPSLLFASAMGSRWFDLLELAHQTPFGRQDPVFGHDVGLYVYVLPVVDLVQGTFVGLTLVSLMACGAWYVVQAIVRDRESPTLNPFARTHLLLLGAFALTLFGADWMLDRYDLLYSQHGVVWGLGYADVEGRLPAYLAMAVISVGCAVTLVAACFRTGWRLPLGALAVYMLTRIGLAGMLPRFIQDYVVLPSELDLEASYLERNIAGTREAFALDRVEVRPFEAATDLTMAEIRENPLTVDNIRVWDTAPLLTTYSQIQEIRTYYEFNDVDIDRYVINGELRQVMLSAREFTPKDLPENARTWVNEHLQYTHGYGLTMSPVNVVTKEGLPALWVQDIPPAIHVDLEINRPELYFGELTDNFVFVRTRAKEFDYPLGDENVYATYDGTGGIPVQGLARKLLMALYLGDLNILLTDYLSDDSRLMIRRDITRRVRTVAPFLRLDGDPYLVVHEGRLVWILDAFSTTDRYPYAEPYVVQPGQLLGGGSGRLGPDRINYLRNSVKAVVDAYDGSVSLYVSDPTDPLVQTWQAIFPESFQPMSDMPEGLVEHIRYPSDFFDAQAEMYRTYHMTDPTVFYNKEDVWQISREVTSRGRAKEERAMPSYYLIMGLPEDEGAEFILLVPFSPANRDNMIAWMAARCDPEHYGKLILYAFPKQKLIYGPRQIEARIDQDPDISQELTLWNQEGSSAQRGNLLVIPIGNSLVYVEPLYLQADSGQLPELKRVIVSYENRIAMEPTLALALRAVFAEELPGLEPPPERAPTAGFEPADPAADGGGVERATAALPGDVAGRIQAATTAFARAKQAQQAGDWAAYGAALDELEAALGSLEGAVPPGGPAPALAPAPEPVSPE